MRAVVFVNRDIPVHLGHVGWGYEVSPGLFRYGAIEIAGSIMCMPHGDNAYFSETALVAKMLDNMKTGQHGGSHFQYGYYKFINVPRPNHLAADMRSQALKPNGYFLAFNNCMDATYAVIVAYAGGDKNILPWPSTHWFPNVFFDDIKAAAHKL